MIKEHSFIVFENPDNSNDKFLARPAKQEIAGQNSAGRSRNRKTRFGLRLPKREQGQAAEGMGL